ncbi:MAG: GNAT family N-acetyltransferase [Sandaracinaceae bacterium]|nr:GNAT family N-acetyltransferase [Sandaracinaceae bacterium]
MWRATTLTDDEAIVALCRALYEEDPAPHPVPVEHLRRTLEVLRGEPVRGRAVVLEANGEVCGYAILISYWSNELGGEICTIDELYVAPSVRGRGHGGALIEALARGEGPWRGRPVALELEVSPDNVRARALYERLGFGLKRNATFRRRLR